LLYPNLESTLNIGNCILCYYPDREGFSEEPAMIFFDTVDDAINTFRRRIISNLYDSFYRDSDWILYQENCCDDLLKNSILTINDSVVIEKERNSIFDPLQYIDIEYCKHNDLKPPDTDYTIAYILSNIYKMGLLNSYRDAIKNIPNCFVCSRKNFVFNGNKQPFECIKPDIVDKILIQFN
jgi:hypothetical protein